EVARRDPGPLRIGLLADSVRAAVPIDPEVAAAVRAVGERLESLGHDVSEASPAALHDQDLIRETQTQWAAGVAESIDTFGEWIGRELTADDVEPFTWFLAQRGRDTSAVETARGADRSMVFRRRMAEWWAEGYDLLLAPTCLQAAPLLGQMSGTPEIPYAGVEVTLAYSTLTAPFNTTGQPAISLPLARTTSGLPIGIQFVADYGLDHRLLQLGHQLEQEYRWADERSPLHP
ncbi:MAG: amidase, partial [Actinobacteria bacterium]|nr:amidase [Actinomycetota bacterium]NIS30224.1 amidase [Actinomycetota bacterium]NIT95013.1 amidase [Actinomycetota bacterium]NIU18697.1 amidase [Actinomycetota bacterium]NIU65471.1 amidase [Actinomycetota bacterium]